MITTALPAHRTDGRAPRALSQDEILRYSRHLILPEVGLAGQRRLKDARVLMVGAGGLGSPLGLYLAAAGIGVLGLVDFDVVELSNLQRQVLHGTATVGRPKIESAAARIADLNPHVEVVPFEARLTSANALDILREFDVVVDGTDNFPTRYLVNDACVLLGKPNVYGSIFRFEGQLSVFFAREGPCYRCLFPEAPPPGLVPSCAEGGVLGVLPGIIGAMQALETIKLILGVGPSLIGRMLLFDGTAARWRELKVRKDPACPICGERPTITAPIDYLEFCGLRQDPAPAPVPSLDPPAFVERFAAGERFRLIDVREPHEWEIVNLSEFGAELIPLGLLGRCLDRLDRHESTVVYCRSGARSAQAVRQMRAAGFERVFNLDGGVLAWHDQVDPAKPKY